MAMISDPSRREAALDWLVRTNDPDFDRWDDFTVWLEQDPANADAYHALNLSESEMRPFVRSDPASAKPKRRRFGLVAGAAALAAAIAVIVVPQVRPVEYETRPGEVQLVSLGGNDQLIMNGGTKLELAGLDRRTVRLEQGQVLLRMGEPGEEQIELLTGDLRIVDVGTIFEVSRDGHETRVLVSEGAVLVDPKGAALKLEAGQRLDTHDGAAVLQAEPADLSSVGSFVDGQLNYLDEPIDNVVADLRRSTGIDFSATAAIGASRFSGTLSVAEVKRDPRSLEPLLGVSIERSGDGWRLGGRG